MGRSHQQQGLAQPGICCPDGLYLTQQNVPSPALLMPGCTIRHTLTCTEGTTCCLQVAAGAVFTPQTCALHVFSLESKTTLEAAISEIRTIPCTKNMSTRQNQLWKFQYTVTQPLLYFVPFSNKSYSIILLFVNKMNTGWPVVNCTSEHFSFLLSHKNLIFLKKSGLWYRRDSSLLVFYAQNAFWCNICENCINFNREFRKLNC